MYYAGDPFESVLKRFKALAEQPEFVALLTGAQGGGKSALLEKVTQYYSEQGYLTRYFPQSPDSPLILRGMLHRSFGWQKTHDFKHDLQKHFFSEAQSHKGIILIFDDCELMNNVTLLEASKLNDIKITDSCMLSIIMCGSDLLNDRINRDHDLRWVKQRVSLSVALPAMDKQASSQFVQKFFDTANQPELVLDAPALALLHNVSKGLPKRITEVASLCSNLHRSQELSSNVSKSELARVLKHPSLKIRRKARIKMPAPSRRYAIPVVAGVTTLALLGAAWITLQPMLTAPVNPGIVTAIVTPPAPAEVMPAISLDVVPQVVVDDAPAAATAPATDSLAVTEPVTATAPEPPPAPQPFIQTVSEADSELEPELAPVSPEHTMRDWIAAWQARDVEAYLSYYHPDFSSRGFNSVSAWQQSRRLNIENREWIEMQVSELSINERADSTTQLQFWLSYQSPDYSDRTRKQLLMQMTDQGWQIIQELNLEIIDDVSQP